MQIFSAIKNDCTEREVMRPPWSSAIQIRNQGRFHRDTYLDGSSRSSATSRWESILIGWLLCKFSPLKHGLGPRLMDLQSRYDNRHRRGANVLLSENLGFFISLTLSFPPLYRYAARMKETKKKPKLGNARGMTMKFSLFLLPTCCSELHQKNNIPGH